MFKINKFINKLGLNSILLPNLKKLSINKRYTNSNVTNFNNNNILDNQTNLLPSSTHIINVPLKQQEIIVTPEKTKNEILKVPTLIGKLVTLRPLNRNDRDELLEASMDGDVWNTNLTIVPGPNTIDKYIDNAFGVDMMPFTIINNKTGRIIGSTRYWRIDLNHRGLEIGHTYLSLPMQKTGINTECKYLLLKYAFEEMNSIRVQFTTDELNENSKRAILRIGAKLEGCIRYERIMPDGRKRNSLRFSIIYDEWENVKLNLQKMMLKKNYDKNNL